jgi:hypothetical protein
VPARTSVTIVQARGLLLAAGMAAAAQAAAQGRADIAVTVPVEIEHDSNPNLAVGPSASTTWLRATPTVGATFHPGNEEFSVEGAVTAEKSSNQEVARDRLDPRLRAAWKHAGPRETLELSALADRRAFRAVGVREQVPLGVDGSRTLYALGGNWQREVDARTRLRAEALQEWTRFSDAADPDFRRTTAAVRFTRQRDERTSWYAALNGQAYDPDSAPAPAVAGFEGTRARVYGAVVGIERSLSPAWQLDANAGPVHFTSPTARGDWQGALKLDYAAERWVVGLELARAPGVNATLGALVMVDELRVRLRHELDARSRIELDAGHDREPATDSRRTVAGAAWLRQLSPAWQLALRVSTHRQQGPEGTARSNRISVLLVYTSAQL